MSITATAVASQYDYRAITNLLTHSCMPECTHASTHTHTQYLMVQLAYPLCKLIGIGDGGRQEHIIDFVWEKDDGLLPHHTPL